MSNLFDHDTSENDDVNDERDVYDNLTMENEYQSSDNNQKILLFVAY